MKKTLLFLSALILVLCPALRAQVFNCGSGFSATTSAACGVGILGPSGTFEVVGSQNGSSPSLSGSSLLFPTGSDHVALSMMYQAAVDVRAFTTTFTFVPNGQNVSFVINNCPSSACGGFHQASFSSGASCEGGFYQGFSGNPFPTNVFALMFDSYAFLHATDGSFTYSNVQLYQQNQSPCNPTSGGSQPYWSTTKLSTSPVPLNSPSGTQNTSTGDTYSATLVYDGSTLTLNLFDVTASGSCPGASCFTQTWANVSIPSQVDGTTGYIGLVFSTGLASSYPLYMRGWTYAVNTPGATPGSTVTSNGSPAASNPSFSPAPGSYSGAQSVTITGTNVCYALGAAGLTIMPLANQLAGCATGTPYTGPVSVSSSQTLYAVAGLNGTGTSSGVVRGVYTIGGGTPTAATPSFSPASGTYTGSQSVSIFTASPGAILCYNFTGSPTTNGATSCGLGSTLYSGPVTVSASHTVYAAAGGTGYLDSGVGSANYTIVPGGIATGDPRSVTEPTFPTGCTPVQATKTLAPSTSLNVDPFNSCISTPGVLGGTGGCSLEPNSETLDNTTAGGGAGWQTTIDTAGISGNPLCVEATMGSSGQDAFVLAPWVPVNNNGAGVHVIVDAGVSLLGSRNPSDYGGSTCGVLPTSKTGQTQCANHWIAPKNASGIQLLGYGQLDARCWDKSTSGGNGFCSNRVQTYCNDQGDNQGNGWQFEGVSCPNHQSFNGFAYGPDMIHASGSGNFTIYKLGFIRSDNFFIYWGDGATGLTVWDAKVLGPANVSNGDGIDPSYAAQSVTIGGNKTVISVGDNFVAIKSDSGSKFTAGPTKDITIGPVQTGAGIGLTAGSDVSGGVNNVLVNGAVQRGNLKSSQSVGIGINSCAGANHGGLVNLMTFENGCSINEIKSVLLSSSYCSSSSSPFPHYTNIGIYNWHTLSGGGSINSSCNTVSSGSNSGCYIIEGYDSGSNKMGLTLDNVIADGGVPNTTSNKNVSVTFGPDPVSTAIQNTLPNGSRSITVANNISTSNPAFTCNNSSWKQLIGELSLSTSGNNNAQGLNVAASSATYTLQAVIRPTTDINTKEQPALSDGSPPYVNFYEDGTLLGSGNIGANGTFATYGPLTRSGPANHVYTATYPGDSFYSAYTFGNPGTGNQVLVSITGGSGTVAQPTFSPNGTSFNPTVAVSMATATAGATQCYTTDGSTPAASTPGTCSHGTTYSGPVTLSSTTTLQALATKSGSTNSGVYSQTYTLAGSPTTSTPTFTPGTSTFSGSLSVAIGCSTPACVIHYTTNGTSPTSGSPVYSAPFTVTTTTTVQALGITSGYANSAIGSAVYTSSSLAATPTFSPLSQAFTGTLSVSIASATGGASIYYTTDGSTPTTGSTLYTGPISITTTTVVNAIAAASGLGNSLVGMATYTFGGNVPTIIPGPQQFSTTLTVSITGPAGATLRYTTDGTTPTTSSPIYAGAFTISSSMTVKAIAVVSGAASLPASVTYTQGTCPGCWWNQ